MKEAKTMLTPRNLRFWKAYVVHMRPYLLFISGAAGLSGMAVAPGFDFLQWKTLLLFTPFFFAYGFGQALTDCFQVDTDRISAPYRPLSRGIISPVQVAVVSLAGLILCTAILVWLNCWNLLFCTLSIIGLGTYSYFKKRFWFAGPFYNSWIVALLPVMGFLVAAGSDPESLHNPSLITTVLLNFFAYANFVLMGYLKDIRADRKTGYRTFPVVFGWNATVWTGDLLVMLSIGLCSLTVIAHPYAAAFLVIASVLAVAGQLHAHFTPEKTEAHSTLSITMTIRSFVLWNLAILLAFHPALLPFALIYYLFFEWVLAKRPMKMQI